MNDDTISRQAAIEACLEGKMDGLPATNVACDCCAERIRVLPSAQPQRTRGTWEAIEGWDGDETYRCSECGEEYVLIDGTPKDNGYHFCPNCGADLRGTK